ncbi:class I SAM-dependent methyltransferase [Sphingomonas sp. G124]|uniref:Class I SAM-dependent methyltransferase n=1 Tax=Sphingomonas cremea TaxID=2904799 RepID=A0A9X1TYK0_9SPHN|nr:class I SAM-dependent methyltransferase [Sphingomonas cremea]MCF2515213.1 class I SAM-dependent methyltransferase [Sphingomonas cremea]
MIERWKAQAGLAVGRQLRHPSGASGRLVGTVMRFANRKPIQAVVGSLDLQPTDRVLDIGCGDGSAIAMMSRANHVVGLDQSDTMIAAAWRRNRAAVRCGRLSLRKGDMMALPFGPKAFDKFAAINILYFCDDVPTLIAGIRRIARPDARLAVYVTAAESMHDWGFATTATHRHFTRELLVQELERSSVPESDRSVEEIALPGGLTGLVATARINPRD